jgi:hypothetical protein
MSDQLCSAAPSAAVAARQTGLLAAMRAACDSRGRPIASYDYMVARFPRLTKAMQWAAILSSSEAGCALRDYVRARDGVYARHAVYRGIEHDPTEDIMLYGGGEAVAHYGGPRKLVRAAASYRVRSAARRVLGSR